MDRFKNKTIGVLMGGLSPEREISLLTGKAVFEAIKNQGLNCLEVDVDHQIAKTLEAKSIDVAFIALHGTYGEDGLIQGLLEYMSIPYTGSGVLGSAIAYDKVISKMIFKQNGIPTADYQVIHKAQREQSKRTLKFPVVVKPSNQGSSLGTSIVNNKKEYEQSLDDAFSYSDEVVVEKYIDGKLLAVGMKGFEPMPIVEIRPKSGFYDYKAKYTPGETEYICPAKLTAPETRRCEQTAVSVMRLLKGRGVPRVDMILDAKGVPQVLEMNTIPGMTQTSLLPKAAKQAGMDFPELVMEILKMAQLDYEVN